MMTDLDKTCLSPLRREARKRQSKGNEAEKETSHKRVGMEMGRKKEGRKEMTGEFFFCGV